MKKKSQLMLILGVFSLIFVTALPNVLNPVLADLPSLYPDVDPTLIGQISSVPALLFIISSIVSAGIIKKIGYKKTLIFACILTLFGGIAPVAIQNFNAVLICRAIFGFGTGIVLTLSKSFLALYFSEDMQARLIGYQNMAGTIFDSILQIITGYIAVYTVVGTYLMHALALVTLIMAIFVLPEPANPANAEGVKTEENSSGQNHIPPIVIILIIMMVCRALPMITVMLNTANLVYELGIGDSSTAGVISSSLMYGTLSAGLLFVYINRFFKRFSLSFGLAVEFTGGLLMSFGKSIPVFIAAYILMGFGMITFCNGLFMQVKNLTPPKSFNLAMGLMTGLAYISNFSSPYYTLVLKKILPNATTQSVFFVGVCIQIAMFILCTVLMLRRKNNPTQDAQ